MKILIIEDEAKTATHLRQGFAEKGFVVDVAQNGADGLYFAASGDYDMVILDIVLPQVSGWSIV
ncbi:MAG: response regulator, partial [Betaproteobacteria bacterium]|nr:response regulator [Betaproteobacteria bacterium]